MTYTIPVFYTPMVAQVLDYVRANPGCTARQMADHFGIHINAVGVHTTRLRDAGMIRRTPGPRRIGMGWEPGLDDGLREKLRKDVCTPKQRKDVCTPKQRIVTEWEPLQVAPQTWLSALG